MIVELILILIGFVLLIKGADFLVDGACNIAKKFRIPEMVIALTIVSIGTSLPELVVSLGSAMNGHSDISVGNVVGSNMANLFLILGTCAIIKPLTYKKQTKYIENFVNLAATLLLFVVANGLVKQNIITRSEGFILLLGTTAFICYNLYMAKNAKKISRKSVEKTSFIEMKKINILKSILMVAIGIALLKLGGDFVVNNAVLLAERLGLSQKLIGITIIAISTSLPELITCVNAAMKGETDMAIGNILGSQIFNICLIIGSSAAISPINYSLSYNKDIVILLFGTLFMCLNPFFGKKDTMTRLNGITFVSVYIIYIIATIIAA
jgi:cation:H+ antiporter